MSEQTAIFILGMHKSGTSAVTRVVNLLGVKIGENLLAPAEDNQAGYWEQKDVIQIHQDLLESQGADWHDTLPLPNGWVDAPAAQKALSDLRALVRAQFKADPFWTVKDPRISLFLPLWTNLADELDFTPKVLFAVRNPLEVAASLEARDRIPEDSALLSWLHYTLMGEIQSRGVKRAFVDYAQLLNNWKPVMEEAGKRIGVAWPKNLDSAAPEIEAFLRKDLRHYTLPQDGIRETSLFRSWCKEIYQELRQACKTGELKTEVFDRIRRDWMGLLSPARSTLVEERLQRTTAERSIELLRAQADTRERNYRGLQHELNRAKEEIHLLERALLAEEHHRNLLLQTTSWRITAPLRAATAFLRLYKLWFKPSAYLTLYSYLREYGFKSLLGKLMGKPQQAPAIYDSSEALTNWFNGYRLPAEELARQRKNEWTSDAPTFSIIMCAYNTKAEWLEQAVESVLAQTYANYELILVDDASPEPHVKAKIAEFAARDPRVKPLYLEANVGVSAASNKGIATVTGEYICFMDHDDFLEPQALFRFAEAVLRDKPDLIYSDEVVTKENIDELNGIAIRPQFSYDYYLSHPYFVHFVAARKEVVLAAGGFNEEMRISQDVDFMLRLFEHCSKISNVGDILYRWRTVPSSLGHAQKDNVMKATSQAIERHLQRRGYAHAQVTYGKCFNFFNVDFGLATPAKIAILIPTKNRSDLLRACIDSLRATVPPELADIYVIDHESNEGETQEYLREISQVHQIIPYSGPFNFSAIMNHGVKALKKPYTHYLLLNNDIEALEPGWLEHMLSHARRPEVGIVGSLLLYPDMRVQHAGVLVGIHHSADHACRFVPYKMGEHHNIYFNGVLTSVRDYSAVTAACMLVRADAFADVNGYDEALAVGYGDTDFCLRVKDAGYKVLFDPYAVLIHHESVSRGKGDALRDPHPKDSVLFRRRWNTMIKSGDPYFSPLLNNANPYFELASPNHMRRSVIRSLDVSLKKAILPESKQPPLRKSA